MICGTGVAEAVIVGATVIINGVGVVVGTTVGTTVGAIVGAVVGDGKIVGDKTASVG